MYDSLVQEESWPESWWELHVQVDPHLLFQRLLLVASKVTSVLEYLYEVRSVLSALFDELLQEADQTDTIWTMANGSEMPNSPVNLMKILVKPGSNCNRNETYWIYFRKT